MFFHDHDTDIYHLIGVGSKARCGATGRFFISIVADESHEGKTCNACEKTPITPEMESNIREILDSF